MNSFFQERPDFSMKFVDDLKTVGCTRRKTLLDKLHRKNDFSRQNDFHSKAVYMHFGETEPSM